MGNAIDKRQVLVRNDSLIGTQSHVYGLLKRRGGFLILSLVVLLQPKLEYALRFAACRCFMNRAYVNDRRGYGLLKAASSH